MIAGAALLVQLNHGGRQHLGRRVGTLIAPSAIACPRSGGIPHALTTREVEEMVEFFVSGGHYSDDMEVARAALDAVGAVIL